MQTRQSFRTGYDFERFCGGFSSVDTGWVAYGPDSQRFDFPTAMVETINLVLARNADQNALKENNAFFWQVFVEVKQHLPKRLRRHLRLLTAFGTPMDYFYGTDFIFSLCRNVAFVDVTLDADGKRNPNCHTFTDWDLERPAMVRFAKEIASYLMGEFRLSDEVYSHVKEKLYKKQ